MRILGAVLGTALFDSVFGVPEAPPSSGGGTAPLFGEVFGVQIFDGVFGLISAPSGVVVQIKRMFFAQLMGG